MIYWDYNASAPLRPEVAKVITEAIVRGAPGNASSVHRQGRAVRERMDAARTKVAQALGCRPKEVCFTASGSEANALAIKGLFLGQKEPKRKRIVLSAIEHPALLSAANQLKSWGADIVLVRPDSNGRVSSESMRSALGPDVALCSLMWANNETGVLQPVEEVALACRELRIPFHADAVQACGKVPLHWSDSSADLVSLSAHKFGGPAGVGALLVRQGLGLQPLTPGHQEGGRRGGTDNVLYAEAMAEALHLATSELTDAAGRMAKLRDRFEHEVQSTIQGVSINGKDVPRVANTSNITFEGADGEALLIVLSFLIIFCFILTLKKVSFRCLITDII